MKIYVGRRDKDFRAVVRVIEDGDSRELDPRYDISNHSPTGFEWGYGGSGPAQLSLAILADSLGDAAMAGALHQKFKWRVIGALPRRESWQLTELEVRKVAGELLATEGGCDGTTSSKPTAGDRSA